MSFAKPIWWQMLSKAKASPDITNYLTFILCSSFPSFDLSTDDLMLARSAAAISLKNLVGSKYESISQEKRDYIKTNILKCVGDSGLQIRNFVGNVITEIVKKGGVLGWPLVYSELFGLAGNEKGDSQPHAQEGAMSAIAKICEDNRKALDRDYDGQRPLDEFLPRLYQLTTSPNVKVRVLALQSINIFIPFKPAALVRSVGTLLQQLFQLANDPSNDVRRFVCRAFVQLVEIAPNAIIPHMTDLVPYMITQQGNMAEPELALEAAEFWLAIGEQDRMSDTLQSYLGKVIPTLLESMVYSGDDIARHEGDRDDAEEEDRDQDIKPQFATSRRGASEVQPKENGRHPQGSFAATDDALSEGEIDEGGRGDEDPEDEWNLRKCSAAALDSLASFFPNEIFQASLPYLRENLQHKQWPKREAAVLAFGAIADGCAEVVAPHLPELIPYLLSLLDDSEPVVRKITCWALGRYTKWIVTLPSSDMQSYLEMVMDGLLKKMMDRNKAVQEGAASAFSNLEEIAKSRLTRYCVPIIQQFVQCFDLYKDRNMFILYDCVQTLAEQVGPALAQPEIQQMLMPVLIKRWDRASDESQELISLLECLSYVATAMGGFFAPYAQPIFNRCIRVVHRHLERQLNAAQELAIDRPTKDFCVTSLDLISAIVQALPPDKSSELVDKSEPKLFDLLRYCMRDGNLEVRQSAYALLGDLAIHQLPLLQPHVPTLVPILLDQIDVASMPDKEAEDAFNVVNNACWACGEISTQDRKGVEQFVDKIYQRLFAIMGNSDIPPSVTENAAIALGRLGLLFAPSLAPHLDKFAKLLLDSLEPVENTDEKGQSLLGFNYVVALNRESMANCLVEYMKMAADLSQSKCRVNGLPDSFLQVTLLLVCSIDCIADIR